MEQETTQKRRGRPRKVAEDNPVAEVVQPLQEASPPAPTMPVPVADASSLVLQIALEELKAMQQQNQMQMAMFMKMAEKMGLTDPPKPPSGDTVVLEPAGPQEEHVLDQFGQEFVRPPEPNQPKPTGRPKPGSLLGNPWDRNVAWVPWRKEDLNPEEVVEFVPAPVPTLVFPMTDEEGRQKIRLDVNDLVCWLTVGIPNRVNRFFKNAYDNGFEAWRELESFKRRGPQVAPWGQVGPDGRQSWYYDPMTTSFGMDENGHAVTPFRSNPLRSFQAADPEAI